MRGGPLGREPAMQARAELVAGVERYIGVTGFAQVPVGPANLKWVVRVRLPLARSKGVG